ncbi:phosphatidylinositol 5-phosphate 4-kinase type-2 alpha isoform X2 [Eurytemora carolleeae]|uniref:phosphatidylinositol 5-phosphate 4-kinase type-2 alpha isoform X2 n=1 Tax=Eurytemora carolleeae TaxID=1294199 RepID=UPI000C787783|nr:phosphatidylinositol 5-phosphate 4-kinase type-2 alpha isoform X2 [Eurytemora carolleeae]|eukprot:XP_023334787.1 phosphatidylinositol 5-phosphate 4-kinase type-2 alpha-like isoform X2 [Eurytemora affinis]
MSSVMEGALKTKTKRFKVKHPKRKIFRSKDPFLSVFMWGVNHTVKELQHVHVPVMLMPDDFRAYSKVKIDNQSFNKENLPSHFKVKEYCPLVFRNIRERFGIDDLDFLNSLTKSPRPVDNPGRSGAKFYISADRMYMMKTLTGIEVAEMHQLLKEYHPYIVERHGKTLLPQYLAMYRLTVENQETYMVVIRNVLGGHLKIHKKYDLKGSTVDREASDKEKAKDCPTFKDNDFLNDGIKISIGDEAKDKLMDTLSADVDFLTKHDIMDYSLLLGIHDTTREDDSLEPEEDEDEDEYDSGGSGGPPLSPDSVGVEGEEEGTIFELGGRIDPSRDIYAIPSQGNGSGPPKEIYFLALVDVLTHYGVKKMTAKAAKTVKYGGSVDGISTVEPDQYAKRFISFISDGIE